MALADLAYLGSAAEAWGSRADVILPPLAITTNQWASEHRVIKGRNEQKAHWTSALTPYVAGIQDSCDNPLVNVVAVKGNARSGKTQAAENHALKRWAHGPYGDMLWYMQSGDDIDDYMEERGEWMLDNHEQVSAKIDRTYKRQARDRKRIGESLARWLAATDKTTRGKAAPFIVADEIDAYIRKVSKTILTKLLNRQREYGSAALMYLCSHPDIGPQYGIEAVLRRSTRHLWWWLCLHCGKPSSPAAEAPIRTSWNVPLLTTGLRNVDRADALAYVRQEAHLICPHCNGAISDKERLVMSRESGTWLAPGQKLIAPGKVEGPAPVTDIMGYVIHGFMSPFINIGKAAEEYAGAYIEFDLNGDDTDLKEVTVKTLGEVYAGATAEVKIADWDVVKKRMQSGDRYLTGYVPDGVDFLTAFVDIQKNRFEVRIIGWAALSRESWLIDAYSVDQWQMTELSQRLRKRPMQKLNPFHDLTDWQILEETVLNQSYPLDRDHDWHMPIAKVGVDTGGEGDTTRNARMWAASVIHRQENPVPDWKILLLKGDAHKEKPEMYGVAKQVMKDDHGQGLKADPYTMMGPVFERTPVVHMIKKIIRKRQNILMPGPGFMHAPQDLADQYFREVVAEKLVGTDWVRDGDNETWDGYVACETVRASLSPEDPTINWDRPPSWAKPFRPGIDPSIDTRGSAVVSPYDRMVRNNRRP